MREAFVVSQDISAEEHVRMQAAMQAFVDNSLSKTINFNAGATVDDVSTAYRLAWKLGCKGITVYVTGSRETVVLETLATADKKKAVDIPLAQPLLINDVRKPRPHALTGFTYSNTTPLGKAFITINENGDSQPFEVFINSAKAGSETAAVSEAIGRLISFILRLSYISKPSERLQEVVDQLAGIGGGRSLGFGPKRIRSMPDGVAQILEEYLSERESRLNGAENNGHLEVHEISIPVMVDQPLLKIGDLCPECGEAAVINEEGCRKCYACGYSEC
jgi:ribonucleoside-diphosphate reductase alpha chain